MTIALNRVSPAVWSLAVALTAFTFTGIFLRLAQQNGMPSVVIASSRLILASCILFPLVWWKYRAEVMRLNRLDLLFSMGAGICIGLHFVFVISSLEYTTFLLNQVIVNTGPIWVAVMEVVLLRVKFSRWVWGGLAIAMAGGFLIAFSGGDNSNATNVTLGNLLALIGCVMGSAYIVVGRRTRDKVSLIPYLWIVYGVGGLVAMVIVGFRGQSFTGYSGTAYFWLMLVTIVSTILGHSSFNHALAYLSATLVTLSGQLTVITSSIFALFILGEIPTTLEVIASAVIMMGVIMAVVAPRPSTYEPSEKP